MSGKKTLIKKLDSRCAVGRYLHMCTKTGGKLIELIHRRRRPYRESIRAVRKFVPKLVKGKDNDRNTYQIVRDKESRTRPKLIPKPETEGITRITRQLWKDIDTDIKKEVSESTD